VGAYLESLISVLRAKHDVISIGIQKYEFHQCCGVGVGRSRRFLGGVRVGFLTTLGVGVGVGFFCPTPTADIQLDYCFNHTLKLGIPAEMVQFLLKLLLKQRFLAVHHDLH